MHESRLVRGLLSRINGLAAAQNATRVLGVSVRLGALSHFSPEHFREHFEAEARGSIADNARLEIEMATDVNADDAQDVLLNSIEIERDEP